MRLIRSMGLAAAALAAACSAGDSDQSAAALSVSATDVVCQETGVRLRSYEVPGSSMHGSYMDRAIHVDAERFVFVSDAAGSANLYLYSAAGVRALTTYSGKGVVADNEVFGMTALVHKGTVFHAADGSIVATDPDSARSRVIARVDAGQQVHAPLQITTDGRWLSARVQDGDRSLVCRFEVATGKRTCLPSPFLGTELPLADHVQIHPTQPDLLMFAHDGSWITDRLWTWRTNLPAAVQLYTQPDRVEMGHELWCRDGSAVCIIQYGSPHHGIVSALNVIGLDDGRMIEQHFVDDLYLSHISPAPGGRYWAVDTYREDSEGRLWMGLMDLDGGRVHLICPVGVGNHPAHPHPSWSADGLRIYYTDLMPDGRIRIIAVERDDILVQSTRSVPVRR
jgi:hypothetical protein